MAPTNEGRFVLCANPGSQFNLLVFYRSLQCPVCTQYLMAIEPTRRVANTPAKSERLGSI